MFKYKNLLLTVAATLTLQCTVSANDIEPGKEFYTAIKAPAPIVLDGDLSEWRGASLLADPRFSIPKGSGDDGELVFFEPYNGGSWDGPDDQTSAVQVVYDDENVYFGFTVTDEYHENAANSAWNGDSIQLMIANEARDQQVALYNYALGGTDEEIGDIIVNHESPAADMGDVLTEAVVIRNTENGRTVYEIKLPKATLGLAELKGGVRFGLGMAINDGDKDTPGQKGWGGLGAHAIVFGKTPSETALVTLATSNDIEPGKEYYTANPTPGDITLDGELDDWTGVPVLSDPRFSIPKGSKRTGELVLFEPYSGGSWSGPDDQTSAVQIAYDADNVYFGFVVTDEYHENAANSAWNGDSIQLMIASKNQDEQIALYNYALGGTEMEIGDIIVNHESGPAAGADAEAVTEAVVKRNTETKRTTYEIKLPKETLGLDSLALGTQFGLGMAINDGDEDTPGQRGWGGLGAHSIVFGKTPSETALVTLGIGGGSSDSMFLSAINVSINSFTFRASDKGESIVDPDSAKLTINGNTVALSAGSKNVDATDFAYTIDGNFEPSTVIEYLIEISDTNGNAVTDTGTITSPTFGLLKAAMLASDVDTSKKGFTYKVWQSDLFSHGNTIAEVENVLAEAPKDIDGSTLDNDAFKDEKGPATASGSEDGHLIAYEIPSVININAFLNGVDLGNFQPDDQMPGVPGNYDSYDGVAVEIVTYVDFPAGLLTMGVNSDDGFELEIGHIDDPRAMVAGKFQGGRGSADTTFLMDVRDAGIYPLRLVYFSQGGDASLELFTVNDAGEKVLVNDTENGGLAAYQVGTAPDYVEPAQPAQPAAMVASSSDALTEPTVVDFGALEGDSSYSFHFTAVKAGASTAIAGNDAFAIKLDQWNEQGIFGTTEFGVADNLFTAVEGGSVNSVFDAPVHVVIVSDSAAGESHLYIDGALSGTWAGNIPFSGDTKVMGARLEQATDHMGEGSVMHSWATYSGLLTAAEITSKFEALPDVSTGGGGDAMAAILSLDGVPAAGSGLDGRYWQAEPKAVSSLQNKGEATDIGLHVINNYYPTGTFTATGLDFQGGNDLTPIQEWLQGDGESYVGADGNMDDGILSFTGYIRIDNPGEIAIRSASDDGSVIWIAGQKVVDNDGGHGAPGPSPDGSYNFEEAGLYPIEIAYYNGDWTNDAGDHGGANLGITANGDPIPGAILYSASDIGATAIAASSIASEAGDAGLHGAYWTTEPKGAQFGEDSQGPIFQNVPGDDHGLALFGTAPQGRFVATTMTYTGNDLTPILEWLGDDSGSFMGTEGDLDDGIFQFTGFLNVAEAGQHSFRSSSDDGSVVRIGNQIVVNNDGGHGSPGPAPDGNAFFPVAGLYPIEVAYFNGDWTNDGGDHGGANIELTMNGESIAGHILQPLGGLGPVGFSSILVDFGGTEGSGAGASPSPWVTIDNLVQDEPVDLGGGVTLTALDDGFNPNNPAPPNEGAEYAGVMVPQEARNDYLFKIADTAGSEARMQITGLPAGTYDVTVFEGRTTDASQFAKIWAGDGNEPDAENTGTFAGDHATVTVTVGEGETLWYKHLEDNSGGISGMIIQAAGGSAGGISAVTLQDGNITIEYTGTLKSSATVNGEFSAVDGASSPYSVAADQDQAFFIAD